jgi:hypothetical protein
LDGRLVGLIKGYKNCRGKSCVRPEGDSGLGGMYAKYDGI